MKIAITGATGFIGQTISNSLASSLYQVVGFSRRPPAGKGNGEEWREFVPEGTLNFSDCSAVIHLAGESILGLWTDAKKRRILQSRVELTRRVVDSLAGGAGPKCLIAASAIGYYGDRGEALCDEDSPSGSGFLAEVCRAWESESARAEDFGIRTVRLRIGFVIGRSGGAIPLIRPIFRAGLGGKLGSGLQWMSCIHVEDIARLAVFCVEHSNISGAVNAVIPEPVRNHEFTREIAKAIHRPAILPAPAFGLRLALGELSHLLLDSQRVLPTRVLQTGYSFAYPTVRTALQEAL